MAWLVHQRLLEKAEVGLEAESATAKLPGLLSLPKTPSASVCLLFTWAPRTF